jgi:hypothetical protein
VSSVCTAVKATPVQEDRFAACSEVSCQRAADVADSDDRRSHSGSFPLGPLGKPDQVHIGERTADLLHRAACAQAAEVDDGEAGVSNSDRTSDFASASSPDRKITRSPPPRASPAGRRR